MANFPTPTQLKWLHYLFNIPSSRSSFHLIQMCSTKTCRTGQLFMSMLVRKKTYIYFYFVLAFNCFVCREYLMGAVETWWLPKCHVKWTFNMFFSSYSLRDGKYAWVKNTKTYISKSQLKSNTNNYSKNDSEVNQHWPYT